MAIIASKINSPIWSLATDYFRVGQGSSLVYKFLLVTPAIMLGVIGGVGRFRHSEYQFLTNTPEQEARLNAYVEPARLTHELLGEYRRDCTPQQLRDLANVWKQGAISGKLKPLESAFYEDSCREGLKGDAVNQNCMVATLMLELSEKEQFKQLWSQSVEDALLAAESVQALRCSDFPSAIQTGIVQRRALALISEAAPYLPPVRRTAAKKRLAALTISIETLQKMAHRAKSLFSDYQDRRGEAVISIEDTQRVFNIQDEMMRQASHKKPINKLPYLADRESSMPMFVSDIRLGINSAMQINKRIANILAQK